VVQVVEVRYSLITKLHAQVKVKVKMETDVKVRVER